MYELQGYLIDLKEIMIIHGESDLVSFGTEEKIIYVIKIIFKNGYELKVKYECFDDMIEVFKGLKTKTKRINNKGEEGNEE